MVYCLSPGSSLALALYSFFPVLLSLMSSTSYLPLSLASKFCHVSLTTHTPPFIPLSTEYYFSIFVASLPLFLSAFLFNSIYPFSTSFLLSNPPQPSVILLQSLYLFTSSVYVSKRTGYGPLHSNSHVFLDVARRGKWFNDLLSFRTRTCLRSRPRIDERNVENCD